jgi:hypothetical protein
MPTYAAKGSVGGQRGDPVTVWAAETPASGSGGASASMAVALPAEYSNGLRPFSVSCKFAGAPGVFEDDIQVADQDVDANYQTIQGGVINTVDATQNTYIVDVPTNTHRFARILCRTQNANAVAKTATIKP